MAFLILWPLSCILTPRALHTVNVFLIRLTVSAAQVFSSSLLFSDIDLPIQSFPTLIVIAIYERFLASGQAFRENGATAAHDIYDSVSRRMKQLPFLERLVGASTTDLYDAIFDVNYASAMDLFEDEEEAEQRPSVMLSDNLRPPSPTPNPNRRAPSPLTPARRTRFGGSPSRSPRQRGGALPSLLEPSQSAEVLHGGPFSPLSRLYTGRPGLTDSRERLHSPTFGHGEAQASVKRLEGLVEEIRGMPVNKLKDEMKELQVSVTSLDVVSNGASLTICRFT